MSPTSYQAAPPRVRIQTNYIVRALLFQVTSIMVPRRGLEPLHLAALAPHASVSTNFTISAKSLITEGSHHVMVLSQYLFFQQLAVLLQVLLGFPNHCPLLLA